MFCRRVCHACFFRIWETGRRLYCARNAGYSLKGAGAVRAKSKMAAPISDPTFESLCRFPIFFIPWYIRVVALFPRTRTPQRLNTRTWSRVRLTRNRVNTICTSEIYIHLDASTFDASVWRAPFSTSGGGVCVCGGGG